MHLVVWNEVVKLASNLGVKKQENRNGSQIQKAKKLKERKQEKWEEKVRNFRKRTNLEARREKRRRFRVWEVGEMEESTESEADEWYQRERERREKLEWSLCVYGLIWEVIGCGRKFETVWLRLYVGPKMSLYAKLPAGFKNSFHRAQLFLWNILKHIEDYFDNIPNSQTIILKKYHWNN